MGTSGTSGTTIEQESGRVSVSGATSVNAGSGDVKLEGVNNDFGGVVSVSGRNVALRDANKLTLGSSTVTGAATLTSGGALTQTGALTVTGTTAINAAGQDVTLDESANDFGGTVSTTARNLTLRDVNALALGASTLTGNATLTVGGALTQSGALVVGGDSVFLVGVQGNGATAAAGPVGASAFLRDLRLTDQDNEFGGAIRISAGAVSLRSKGDMRVVSLVSGADSEVTLQAGGTLSMPGSAIDTGEAKLTLISGGALATAGTLKGADMRLEGIKGVILDHDVTTSGTLSLVTSDSLIQQRAGRVAVGGRTQVNTGLGDVSLGSALNEFEGAIAVNAGGALVRDRSSLVIESLNLTKALSLEAESVSQTGSVRVGGDATVVARSGNVVLSHSANDFVGTVTAVGNDVFLVDSNTLSTNVRSNNATLQSRGVLTVSLFNRNGEDKNGVGAVSISTGGSDVVFPQSKFNGQMLRLTDISAVRTNTTEPARLLRFGPDTQAITVGPSGQSVLGVLRSITASNPDMLFNGVPWYYYTAAGLTSRSTYWWLTGSDDRDLVGPVKLMDTDGFTSLLKAPATTFADLIESNPATTTGVRGVVCTDGELSKEGSERVFSGRCP
jgi:hypothetical protein